MTSKFLVRSTGRSELPLPKTEKSKERKDLGRTYQELGLVWDAFEMCTGRPSREAKQEVGY